MVLVGYAKALGQSSVDCPVRTCKIFILKQFLGERLRVLILFTYR